MRNIVRALCWASLILLAAGSARAGWVGRDTVRFLILAFAVLAVVTMNRAAHRRPKTEDRA